MKNLLYILTSGALLFVLSSGTGDNGALEAEMNTLKAECKALMKNARYEGAKITYYTPAAAKQVKEVELFLFTSDPYIFAVSTKKCSQPVTIRIYDATSDVPERILLKEFKSQKGRNFTFASEDLNKIYRRQMPEVERLKNIVAEYSIPSGKGGKEGVVLTIGRL